MGDDNSDQVALLVVLALRFIIPLFIPRLRARQSLRRWSSTRLRPREQMAQ